MKISLTTTAIAVLSLIGASAASIAATNGANTPVKQAIQAKKTIEQDGKTLYFVELRDAPVATYKGGVNQLTATSIKANSANRTDRGKLDVNSGVSQAYRSHLINQQAQFRTQAKGLLKQSVEFRSQYQLAVNAVTMFLDEKQVTQLRASSMVKSVAPVQRRELTTDTGPRFIGADQIWDGSAASDGVASRGEGIVVGVLDTGINHSSASFTDLTEDGYDHSNPWGAGVYSGDCVEHEQLCNDKLIGIHSYDYITSNYGNYGEEEIGLDHHGHGSHTASTAAGNPVTTPIYNVINEASAATVKVSGVAPRANIVSYQTCNATSGCWPDAAIEAIEHAISVGVDVLNYSVGGGMSSPWGDTETLAWLSAREAGIHAVTSAGNAGPSAYTGGSPGNAPWIVTVAAGTHDRGVTPVTLDGFSGGETAPSSISGKAITAAYSGTVVYAGDYDEFGPEDDRDGQCLTPFAADTFAGEIVLCKRGEIARVEKGSNVRAGGAGGLILANVSADADDVVADPHSLPAIHVDMAQGQVLLDWLATGSDHSASISSSMLTSDMSYANNVAWFSSRGPNWDLDPVYDSMMTPDITAPGVSIYAANSENQPFFDPSERLETPYRYMDGTSMATPHVAGALALIKATRPEWTPAEAHSAIMMTANQGMQSEVLVEVDGVTETALESADFFDMGAGMMQLEKAVNAGLVLHASIESYLAAEPYADNSNAIELHQLNMASMAKAQCVLDCDWQRTLTATEDTGWTVSYEYLNDGMSISVDQPRFTLAKGESITLTVMASADGSSDDAWLFGNVVLTPDNSNLPTLRMPVAANFVLGTAPTVVTQTVLGDSGSVAIEPIVAAGVDELTAQIDGFVLAERFEGSAYDDANDDVFNPSRADSLWHKRFIVEPGTKAVFIAIEEADASDLDLFVGIDKDLDGELSGQKEWSLGGVCFSAGVDSMESCVLTEPEPGIYYATVHNFEGTSADAEDSHVLSIATLADEQTRSTVSIPTDVSARTPFALTVNFQGLNQPESTYLGLLSVGTEGTAVDSIGQTVITLKRGATVVEAIEPEVQFAYAGEQLSFAAVIEANTSGADRTVVVSTTLPDGWQAAEVPANAQIDGQTVVWTIEQAAGAAAIEISLMVDTSATTGVVNHAMSFDFSVNGVSAGAVAAAEVTVEGMPIALIDGQAFTSYSVAETNSIMVSMADSSGPLADDTLTYEWTQTAGPDVALVVSDQQATFNAPEVEADTAFSYQLVVSNGRNSSAAATLSITVTNTPPPVEENSGGSSSGSTGGAVLALLMMLAWQRRR